jgi:hypothetical protein
MKRVPAVVLFLIALTYSQLSHANCNTDAANEPPAVWKMLLQPSGSSDLRIHAEASTSDSRLRLLLYSRRGSLPADNQGWTLHLAAFEVNAKEPSLVFDEDITRFEPADPMNTAPFEPAGACLNTFVISGGFQAIHLTVRMRSKDEKPRTAASDLILVILEDDSLQPVLHLSDTTRSEMSKDVEIVSRDSEILLFGPKGEVNEVLWVLNRRGGLQVIQASMTESTLYRFGDRGFLKIGPLAERELQERRRTGRVLARGQSSQAEQGASDLTFSTN